MDERPEEEEEEDEEEEEMIRRVVEELEDMMTSLTRRMIKSEMEDFELVRCEIGLTVSVQTREIKTSEFGPFLDTVTP